MHHVLAGASGGQRASSHPLEVVVVSYLIWVLGAEPES